MRKDHDDSSLLRLENAKDRLAEAMRAMVLAANAINTEEIVRNQLDNKSFPDEENRDEEPVPVNTPSPLIGTRRPTAPG